jgi:hypothetical protein
MKIKNPRGFSLTIIEMEIGKSEKKIPHIFRFFPNTNTNADGKNTQSQFFTKLFPQSNEIHQSVKLSFSCRIATMLNKG